MIGVTMHPCLLLGAYALDHDRMPADEFQIRMERANAIMDSRGWQALFVYGDAMEHRALAWLTNFIPRMRWAMAMLPREGDPRLLISVGSRDIPAQRLMTWITDVHSGWNWSEVFDLWFEGFVGGEADEPMRVGTLGQDLMREPFLATLSESIKGRVVLERADADFDPLFAAKRPRELTMIREACGAVDAAAEAMSATWRAGADSMTAAIVAERTARAMAAHDVRILFSVDGGRTLLPFFGVTKGCSDPLVAYIAVKRMGYWADGFVTITDRPNEALERARAAVDSLLAAAQPGVDSDTLAKAAAIDGISSHPILSGSVGHPIGLSLAETPLLQPGTGARLDPGRVYSLRVGVADDTSGHAVLSAVVRVNKNGVEILRRSG